MATITTRAGKGSPLTHAEMDANLTGLNVEVIAATADIAALATVAVTGAYADLSGIPATFAPSVHTQAAATITDFAEAVDDRVAALLVAGTNMTITYNDVAGTLTLDAAGGGGGGATNLTWTAATSTVASDTGTDAVITLSDGTNAGLMSAAGFTKLAAITGTNTGDQTSIVGITGTKAQFNAAVTDGDPLYVGDVTTNATHTGDATGATALTLATVNANVGSFGSATQVATFTANAKGLTTAAGNTAIAIPSTQVTDFTEAAQDAVGMAVGVSLFYDDATPRFERAALTGAITAAQNSNATALGSFTKAQLDGAVSDGNVAYAGDAPTAHTHPLADLTQSGATTGQVPQWDGSAWVPATVAGDAGPSAAYDYGVSVALNRNAFIF